MKCYLCLKDLDDKTTIEHIIHNFLGGRLKSNQIICSECNLETSQSIDAELSKQLIIGRLTDVKRDRSSSQKIAATSSEGVRYFVNPGAQQAEQRPTKPKEFYDQDGEFTIEVRGQKAIEEFIKAYKKNHPDLSDEEIERKIQRFSEPKDVEVYPDGHGMQPLNNPEPYRAIAKIAANYYAYCTSDYSALREISTFIKDGQDVEEGVYPFYGFSREEIGITAEETSHLLILVGDKEKRLLYCYMEIFNVYNFVVVLNLDYKGSNIKHYYKYNFETNSSSVDEILVEFKSDVIRNLVFPGVNSDKGFGERMRAFATANGIRLSSRPNNNIQD